MNAPYPSHISQFPIIDFFTNVFSFPSLKINAPRQLPLLPLPPLTRTWFKIWRPKPKFRESLTSRFSVVYTNLTKKPWTAFVSRDNRKTFNGHKTIQLDPLREIIPSVYRLFELYVSWNTALLRRACNAVAGETEKKTHVDRMTRESKKSATGRHGFRVRFSSSNSLLSQSSGHVSIAIINFSFLSEFRYISARARAHAHTNTCCLRQSRRTTDVAATTQKRNRNCVIKPRFYSLSLHENSHNDDVVFGSISTFDRVRRRSKTRCRCLHSTTTDRFHASVRISPIDVA